MRVAFIIQGEGRGHMTQAITLKNMLESNGHQVVACLVGQLNKNSDFGLLQGEFDCELSAISSPNIYYKKTGEMVLSLTIINAFRRSGRYFSNLRVIKSIVETSQADLIINFYDMLGGFYNLFLNHSKVPYIAIAHQFFLSHENFIYPRGHFFNQSAIQTNNFIISFMANKVLALSFRPESQSSQKNLVVVPPLIRDIIKSAAPVAIEDFVLAYCSQPYMVDDLLGWKKDTAKAKCYTAKNNLNAKVAQENHIELCAIDPHTFIDDMIICSEVFTTSGFESICEAAYLGKEITIVPMREHYEQLCNAHDAERVGIAHRIGSEKVTKFSKPDFQDWVNSADAVHLSEIEAVVNAKSSSSILKLAIVKVAKALTLAFIYVLRPFYPSCRPSR